MAAYASSNGFRTGSKTPVSILQELLLRNNIVPHYELIHNGVGTHEPQFKYKLQAGEFMAIGSGKSKKEAKHDAARSVLKRMHYNKALTESAHVEPEEDIDIESPYCGAVKANVVGQLTDLCIINNLPSPEYIPVREEGPPHARIFTYECVVSTRSEIAVARTKKQAKHMVSQQMINRLSDILGDKMVLVPEKILDPDTDEPESTSLLMLEGVKKNHLNLGLLVSQYNHILPEDAESVPILEDLKGRNPFWIQNHPTPQCLLEEIALNLKFEYEIKRFNANFNSMVQKIADITLDEDSDEYFFGESDSDECSTEETSNNVKINAHYNEQQNKKNLMKNDSISDIPEKDKLFILTIDSSPPRAFFGTGKTDDDAIRKATIDAIMFYFYMLQPLK